MLTCVTVCVCVCVCLCVCVRVQAEAFHDDVSSDPEGGLAWLDDAMTMVCS